jgi:hypothetical protein
VDVLPNSHLDLELLDELNRTFLPPIMMGHTLSYMAEKNLYNHSAVIEAGAALAPKGLTQLLKNNLR